MALSLPGRIFPANTVQDDVWVHSIEMHGEKVSIRIGHRSGIYDLTDFSLIWFRRGSLVNKVRPVTNNLFPDDQVIDTQINNHLAHELTALNEFVYGHIPNVVRQINNPAKYSINKLGCLYEAARIGTL